MVSSWTQARLYVGSAMILDFRFLDLFFSDRV